MDIKLDMTMAQFIDLVDDLRDWILEQANKGIDPTKKFTRKQLFIKNVTAGSVNCLTTLSVGDSSLVGSIANGINEGLATSPKIGSDGVTIIGTAVAAVFTAPTEESSSTSTGLILGLTIPLGLLFLVAIILIIWRLKSRKNDDEEENEKHSAGNNYSSKQFGSERFEEKI
jgi:hypothetical protein